MVSSDDVIEAFKNGYKAQGGNYFTDGERLYLFGNLIAKKEGGRIHVTNAGYATVTTHKALNRVGAHVRTKRGEVHLNDMPWNGGWTPI